MTTLQQAALDHHHRLENLLDQLTTRHQVEIHDAGRLIGVRTDEPLLAQLRRAKSTPTTYAPDPGNGGALARHERTTLNTAAVRLYADIETRTHAWATRAGYHRHTPGWPHPEQVLTAWWALTKHDADIRTYTATLQTWVRQIADLLDPPHRFDIDKPCPICRIHVLEVDTETGIRVVRALAGVEREPDIHQVTCRSCGAEWDGLDAAQELADEIAYAEFLDRIARRWQDTLAAWDRLTAAAIEARATA